MHFVDVIRMFISTVSFLAQLDSGIASLQSFFWHFPSLGSFYSTVLDALHLCLLFLLGKLHPAREHTFLSNLYSLEIID